MGVTSYALSTATTQVSSVSGNVIYGLEGYDNPTLNAEDRQRASTSGSVVGTSVVTSGATHVTGTNQVVVIVPQAPVREMSKFKEMPHHRGDNLRLAFLIGFPLVFFIVGVIFTGTSV